MVWFNGRSTKAHRLAYELARGPIPSGLQVLRSCDVRRCCEPSHLRVGTNNNDNMRDKVARWRQAFLRGSTNGMAKLTEGDVHAIRDALVRGERIVALARRHGVAHSIISDIARGRIWRHVTSSTKEKER
jgi:hypothetical protein